MDFSGIGQSLCNTAYSQLRQTCLFIVFPHKKGFLKGYGSLFMNHKGGIFGGVFSSVNEQNMS